MGIGISQPDHTEANTKRVMESGHDDSSTQDHQQAAATDGVSADGLTKSIFKNGRYHNPWDGWKMMGFKDVFRMMLERSHSNVPSKRELDKTLPIVHPDLQLLQNPPESGIRVTWIGHATVLVQFDGITVLTDPLFSARCAMTQFFGPKRYRDVPCTINELPQIDAVVISHTHYDHLDYNSVVQLNNRFGKDLSWFVPMGLTPWMRSRGCETVIEMDWWQEWDLHRTNNSIKFAFTPSQHWCQRGPTDYNKVLWGSWCIFGPRNSFFFGGDTGYCEGFKQIGKRYGRFDLAAIPIGAYEPRWFMKFAHVSPEEAVKIHQDINAKKSVGIHWGTFVLTKEFYLEPAQKLKEELTKVGLTEEDFFTLNHGESRTVNDEDGHAE